ncbi:MAG TPA: hypothetical protein VHK26_10190 [Methyloceanibacter sp.]|jgi:hypothetical protein|nr:hypothetical protein [Methyloceanibacter sp.]
MWKIVVILLLTALAILMARLIYEAPVLQTRVGAIVSEMQGGAPAPLAPPLMYAGVRG